MRNLKKLLAVIMAVAMLASIMVPALAADYDDDAQKLYNLGLFKGSSGSSYQPDLDGKLTREQGLTLMIRAMGKDEEALGMSEAEINEQLAKVEDAADITDWARPYVAYAVKNGLTKGIGGATPPNIRFGAQLDLSGKEFINFMLYAMGYPDAWDIVLDKAVEIGMLTAGEAVKFGSMDVIIRDVAIGIMAGSMGGTTAAGITLAQALVEAGVVSEEDMVEAGYMAPLATPTPEVITAEAFADNLLQLYVVFSAEVDKESAEDKDNYSIEKVKIADASLQDDGVTVVLTFDYDSARNQQDVVDLTVDGVKALDGSAIDEFTIEDIEFVDTTIPTALDAVVVGKDTIKVTFSEPMKGDKNSKDELDKKDFVVNGGKSYVRSVKLQNNYTEALVEMYSDLKEGDLTIQIKSGSEDFAGFGVIGKTFDIEVVPDEEAPEVIGYEKASRSEVTLIWNEDIEFNGKIEREDYYHTNAKNKVRDWDKDDEDIVPVKIDGNKMTLYFDDESLMANGTSYVYVMKEAVRDLWDNENTQQMIQIEIARDDTPPEVDKIEVKEENKIEIKFTEELDKKSAEDDDNYTILDDKGDEIKNIIDDIVYSSKKVTITFEENLSGDYSIVIEKVEDKAGNKIVKTTIDFNVGDKTAPKSNEFKGTLYNAAKEDQMIKIDFDDVMETEGKYSVTDVENYVIVTAAGVEECKLEKIEDVEINVVDDGKAVEIFIPSYEDIKDDVDDPESGKHYFDFTVTADNSDFYLQISRVADAAGNKMDKMVEIIEIDVSATIDIKKVEATARDTIEVTFGDKLADFEEDDLIITLGGVGDDAEKTYTGKDIAGVDTKENDDGNTVAVITLDDDEDNLLPWNVSETEDIALYVTTINKDSESENRYGKKLTKNQSVKAADKIKPELYDDGNDKTKKDVGDYLAYEVDNSAGTVTFYVYFTEDMKTTDYDTDYNYVGADFAIYYDHDKDPLVNGSAYEVTKIDDNIVTIVVDVTKLVDGEDAGGGKKQYKDKADFEIKLVSKPRYLTDKAGNKPDSEEFGAIDVEDVTFDCTK